MPGPGTEAIEAPFIDRAAIGRFILDPRSVLAFEAMQRAAFETNPADIATAQETADAGVADAAAAQATAAGAQATADTIAAAAFVVLSASGALSAERVLTGSTGVTIDTATAGLVKVMVDALAILNAAAVVLTQPVDVQNALRCDSLRIDDAATASVTASTHSVPISVNGTTYYMRLSNTP